MDYYQKENETDLLENIVDNDEVTEIILQEKEDDKPPNFKKFTADSIPQTILGTLLGTVPDYFTGLNPIGILVSRAAALVTNYTIGGLYGGWREKVFNATNINQDKHFFKKWGMEILSYQTFQVPIYAAGVALGSLISDNEFDSEKVLYAALFQIVASPVTSLALGVGMDKTRTKLDVEPVAWNKYDKKV